VSRFPSFLGGGGTLTIDTPTRMQNDPVVSRASELMRLGLMPSCKQVRGGLVRRILLQFES